jgi:2-C-methyl-D-erythritol 4-phosphate cytidylyltransferase
MQGAVEDKVLAPLAGRPVFAYSGAAFLESGVADLYVVVYRDLRQMLALSAAAPTPSMLIRGGRTRQDSVMHALAALPGDIAYVFVHDCARPLVQPQQLIALHEVVRKKNAVVLAHRVTDTIKESSGTALRRLRTLDRSRLWAMETPQVFAKDLIVRAYARVAERGLHVTDDAGAVEGLGHPVAIVENPHPNPKLTTPADMAYLEFLMRNSREEERVP